MSSADDAAALDDRVDRALADPMVIDDLAPGVFEVQTLGGETYRVDPSLGACQCDDFEYRTSQTDGLVCKHCIAVVARRGPDATIDR